MSDTTSKRPTHRAYAVKKQGEKNYWHEIGAVWAHEDGQGFSLKLALLPIDGSDIVIRVPKPKQAGQGDAP